MSDNLQLYTESKLSAWQEACSLDEMGCRSLEGNQQKQGNCDQEFQEMWPTLTERKMMR